MSDLILTLLLCSAVCFGAYSAFQYEWSYIDQEYEFKMIFGGVAMFLDKYLPEHIKMPIYGCPVCMTTIYTPLTWFCLGNEFTPLILPVWVGVAGINWLIVKNLEV